MRADLGCRIYARAERGRSPQDEILAVGNPPRFVGRRAANGSADWGLRSWLESGGSAVRTLRYRPAVPDHAVTVDNLLKLSSSLCDLCCGKTRLGAPCS